MTGSSRKRNGLLQAGASQIFAVFFQRREHEAAEFTLRVFARTHYLMFSALKIWRQVELL